MLKLKVKKLDPAAKLPTKAHIGDMCWDLYAINDIELPYGNPIKVSTGLVFELPDGYGAIIEEKSGLASQGVEILGGIIDNAYRGEIIVVMKCNPQNFHLIKAGNKIAQIRLVPIIGAEIVEVTELSVTERGENGFGSTGN